MAGLGSFLQGAAGGMAMGKQMENQKKQSDMLDKVATTQPGTQQQAGAMPQQQPAQPTQGAGLSAQQPAQPQADNSWAFVRSLFGGNA